jgi:UDP-glucose 4-epimerase
MQLPAHLIKGSQSMIIKNALVTGGAGFIGSHIVQQLLEEGLNVTVVDDLSMGSRNNVPSDARFVEGNIRDLSLMRKLAGEADVVFHQAAKVSVRISLDQSFEDAETNLMGTLNMLRACQGNRVKKFIYASSMAVYSDSKEAVPINEEAPKDPISPYGVAKLAAERYCLLMAQQYGLDCMVLRYFNTFGPRQTFTPYVGVITIFINKLLAGESPVIFGDGNQLRDFVYVGDIARANILAMKSEATQEVINIGTGRSTSVNEVAALLQSRINPAIEVLHEDEQPGELKISFPDISRATEKIGYKPQWSLDQKIDEVIEDIKSQPGR